MVRRSGAQLLLLAAFLLVHANAFLIQAPVFSARVLPALKSAQTRSMSTFVRMSDDNNDVAKNINKASTGLEAAVKTLPPQVLLMSLEKKSIERARAR